MPPLRSVVRFMVIAALWYAALMVAWPRIGPWPGIGPAYPTWLSTIGNMFVPPVHEAWEIRFRPAHEPNLGSKDAWVIASKVDTRVQAGAPFNSMMVGYAPTVAFAALMLAGAGWRYRLTGLVIGLPLIHAFVLLRLWVYAWCLTDAGVAGKVGRAGLRDALLHMFMGDTTVPYIAAGAAWLIASYVAAGLVASRPLAQRASKSVSRACT